MELLGLLEYVLLSDILVPFCESVAFVVLVIFYYVAPFTVTLNVYS